MAAAPADVFVAALTTTSIGHSGCGREAPGNNIATSLARRVARPAGSSRRSGCAVMTIDYREARDGQPTSASNLSAYRNDQGLKEIHRLGAEVEKVLLRRDELTMF